MFFALSGFLITYLLLLEKEQGGVDVRNFYVRRLLRIWPLYYAYLAASLLVIWFTEPGELPGSLVYYVILAANVPMILDTALPHLIHYWSLGVEEQFYLFWPWVVRSAKRVLAAITVFAVAFLLLKIFARVVEVSEGLAWPYLALYITRFECMAIGAVGAVLFRRNHQRFMSIAQSMGAQVVAWGVVAATALNSFHIASVVDHDIVAVVTVVIIVNVAANPRSLVNLERRVPDAIGRISYGIYVIHPLLIFLIGKGMGPYVSEWGTLAKLCFVYAGLPAVTVLVAFASYELFERRFLNFKTRFSTIKSHD
jgi:peptidoglycan/LPS O-acetylase OafA/YrhL